MKEKKKPDTVSALEFARGDIFFRLTYEGIRGWRLRISPTPEMNYIPATESLARFLGEDKLPEPEELFTEDRLTVREQRGSRVELAPGRTGMKFISKDGRVITEIISVSLSDGRLVIEGSLDAT